MIKQLKISALFIGSLILSSCGGDKTPSDVSVSMMEALYDRDMEGVIERLNLNEKDKAFIQSTFRTKVGSLVDGEIIKHGSVDSIEAKDEVFSDDGNKCKLQLTITFEDGTKKTETVKLSKIDGKWLVDFK